MGGHPAPPHPFILQKCVFEDVFSLKIEVHFQLKRYCHPIVIIVIIYKRYYYPIIIAQKKILRAMTFSEINAHTALLFSQLGILKVHDVHQFHLLSFVYDCYYKIAPAHFHSYFKPSSEVHNYNTRMASMGDIFLQRKNTFQCRIRYIQYTGARLWNMIPLSMRSSPSSSVFRSELKTYLLSNYDMLS